MMLSFFQILPDFHKLSIFTMSCYKAGITNNLGHLTPFNLPYVD